MYSNINTDHALYIVARWLEHLRGPFARLLLADRKSLRPSPPFGSQDHLLQKSHLEKPSEPDWSPSTVWHLQSA
jgi:hypothetical protein